MSVGKTNKIESFQKKSTSAFCSICWLLFGCCHTNHLSFPTLISISIAKLNLFVDNKNQDLAQPYRIILGLKIQCLRYHKDELTVLLETIDHKPDILALTEIWIEEEDSAEKYTLRDY